MNLSRPGRCGLAGVSAAWMRLPSLQGRIHGVPRVPNLTGPPAASAFRDHPRHHPRGAAPLAGNFLTLRNARCGSVLTTMQDSTLADQSPQKTLAGSHFYAALILINGLVVIGLHNGGPFGTARRLSLQREGASGGKQY